MMVEDDIENTDRPDEIRLVYFLRLCLSLFLLLSHVARALLVKVEVEHEEKEES